METVELPLTWRGATKDFSVHFCKQDEMRAIMRERGIRGYRLDGAIPPDIKRAFRVPDEIPAEGFEEQVGKRVLIYVNDDFPIGTLMRLGHEIGHGFEQDHPDARGEGWEAHLPAIGHAMGCGFGTMSYSFYLRWVDWEGLVPLAQQVVAARKT